MSKGLLEQYASLVDAALPKYLPEENLPQSIAFDACRYSLLAGGKRIRPALLLAFYEQCGGQAEDALSIACAMEMIHTYSLIHDDLPCMDNDDLRRGRPTNHIVFGDAMALLAGDGLLTRAFEVILETRSIRAERVLRCASYIAHQSGLYGMVGGQALDLSDDKLKNEQIQDLMIDLKTGALLRASCVGGCLLAAADEKTLESAMTYSTNLGLAFQIMDDLLDVTGDPGVMGKAAHQDEHQGKRTFVSRYGIEGCRGMIRNYTQKAVSAVENLPDPSALQAFACALAVRNH